MLCTALGHAPRKYRATSIAVLTTALADERLSSYAIEALRRLGARECRPEIERLLRNPASPRRTQREAQKTLDLWTRKPSGKKEQQLSPSAVQDLRPPSTCIEVDIDGLSVLLSRLSEDRAKLQPACRSILEEVGNADVDATLFFRIPLARAPDVGVEVFVDDVDTFEVSLWGDKEAAEYEPDEE
jgi:hypothetical protein